MEPIDYGGALLRRWWLVLVVACIGAVVALVFRPPTPRLTLPRPAHGSGGRRRWSARCLPGRCAQTVGTAQIVFYASESSVIDAAAKKAGLHGSPDQLGWWLPQTGLIPPHLPASTTGRALKRRLLPSPRLVRSGSPLSVRRRSSRLRLGMPMPLRWVAIQHLTSDHYQTRVRRQLEQMWRRCRAA